MIRIAIVEDEAEQRQGILNFAASYAKDYERTVCTYSYDDGDCLLDDYAPGKFDILLLDIQMKRMNGMEAAERIRKLDQKVIILFITNMAQYAIQGYGVQAMDFIVKPLFYESFAKKLDRAVEKVLSQNRDLLRIRSLEGMLQLDKNEITCVELVSRKLYIHTREHSYPCNETMQGIEEQLADPGFFRCHAGYLVNLSYIKKIDRSSALLTDREIPISKHRRRDLLDALTNYMGNKQ